MARWLPASWTWKDTADACEFASAAAGIVLGVWLTTASPGAKTLPAALTAAAAGGTLVAKTASRILEWRKNAEQAKRARSLVARIMRAVLDEMRQVYFLHEGGAELYKHRVTLFVCVDANASTGKDKHLAIFARSGVRGDSKSVWALDDNHPDGCRGFAGKVWYHSVTMFRVAVCDWPKNEDYIEKERYANSMEITIEEAESLNVRSRTFAGTPVLVRGHKWGVLLLDSLKADSIAETAHQKGLLNRYTELIGKILTEAEV